MQRPTPLTVFGVLNLVVGLYVVGVILYMQAIFVTVPAAANNLHLDDPIGAMSWRITSVGTIVSSIAMMIAGVGLLRMKAWGRYLSIVWAAFTILMSVTLSIFISFLSLLQ